MDQHIRLHATTLAIVVTAGFAVSFVTSTVVAARAFTARSTQDLDARRTIDVKGSTRQRIRSDRAVWRITVSGNGPTLQQAFTVIDTGVQRVGRFLRDMGFGDGEIGLAAIDTCEHYVRDADGNATREIAEYTLDRRFIVTTTDVDRVNRTAGLVTQLIEEGVHVISFAPEYYFTQLAQLKIDLMAAASADAYARAERIASSTGATLGELRDAQMGVLQITQPHSTEVSSYGIYDTSTIDKDVRAVVSATFGIRMK